MKIKVATITVLGALPFVSFAQDTPSEEPKEKKEKQVKKAKPMTYKIENLKAHDADKDGKLNAEEYKAFLEARKKATLEKFDTDKDGELNSEEKKAAIVAKRQKLLEIHDTDKDGELSKKESAAMKVAQYDFNGNGTLDPEEKALIPQKKGKKKK